MSDIEKVEVGKQRSENGQLVTFGIIEGNAFHPFYTERSGDYDERNAAAAETQPDTKKKA